VREVPRYRGSGQLAAPVAIDIIGHYRRARSMASPA
jgi:hypothetical protein